MITVTENAVKQLHALLDSPSATPGAEGLRLLVAKGGCAGMEYQMKLDSEAAGDEVLRKGGVAVFVDPESLAYLDGCEVDYIDDLTDSGFKINNPNAARACGCGSSFEPKGEAGAAPEEYVAEEGSCKA